MDKKALLERISATIYLKDGSSFSGQLDLSTNKFDFHNLRFLHVSSNLKIRNVNDDGSVTIIYIFESDYLPRVFNLKENEPIRIKDYLGMEPIRIELIID